MRLRHLLVLLGLAGASNVAAQAPAELPFYSPDTMRVQQLAAAHRASVRQHFTAGAPKAGSGEYRDHYRRIAQEAAEEVYNSVRYAALLDPVLEPAVQRVFTKIKEANPQLPAVQLVLSRSPEPNAHAMGNGTVMLNLGLLAHLENESQLAFILCHELAHVQARHMDSGLREQLTTLHSKELKREVRRIVSEEYNINSKLKTLALGMSLSSNYHQRKYEKQADSLGYVLLRRTTFDATQAYRALELLDKMDAPYSTERLDLARYFGCAAAPYGYETAPAKPRSIFTVGAKATVELETSDTLKSHPDCAKRMRFVRELAQGQVADGPPTAAPTPEWAHVVALSRLEVVQSWFDYDCYDHALFEALQLLPTQPQSAYLRSVVTLSLYELREHLVDHRFMEVVSNVSKHNPENFNQLLTALYAWKAEDYKKLTACFAQQIAPAPAADEYALAARYAAATLAEEPATTDLRQQYLKTYQKGKFAKLLFTQKQASTAKK
ncbi:MAG: M48 family metallopeptidase [Janthinobacterium lividum]